jgi:hypothetical protein
MKSTLGLAITLTLEGYKTNAAELGAGGSCL